jgi:1-hydroxycarotenoid 3,4-desaturase
MRTTPADGGGPGGGLSPRSVRNGCNVLLSHANVKLNQHSLAARRRAAMGATRVAVIGAGVGGLVAAALLARRGLEVVVLERAAAPGGKMREVAIGDARLDAGPTVFTLRDVFEEIFAAAGGSLDAHLALTPAATLARHAWSDRERLDLFADRRRSAEAIGEFAGPDEGRRYLAFCAEAGRIYRTLEASFIRAARPSPLSLARRVGWRRLPQLWRLRPFSSMWGTLGSHFRDPRLRQLFGRYATYCGSSPFAAPATLMLVAHVEQEGVWLVEGGMHRLAQALQHLAEAGGARFRFGAEVRRIEAGGRTSGVVLADGERLAAEAVIANADAAAIARGLFGAAAAAAVPRPLPQARSLSAITWNAVARTSGLPLLRHTVFFSRDYAAEFDSIFRHRRPPPSPTVYVCAQDRDDRGPGAASSAERLLCLINAPADGDVNRYDAERIAAAQASAFGGLARCGLTVELDTARTVVTTPHDFERLFPGTGGALYGPASHGWRASFSRPGARTRLPGLYLAGGSAHPGPGVPMAALSGRLAAEAVLADLAP